MARDAGARTVTAEDYQAAIVLDDPRWPKQKRELAHMLNAYAIGYGLDLAAEHVFHPTRKWRFDWAFPEIKVAVEFDGLYGGKAHTSVNMVAKDSEKMNQAQIHGWTVIRVNSASLRNESGYRDIEQAIDAACGGEE